LPVHRYKKLDQILFFHYTFGVLVKNYAVVSAVGRMPNPVADFLWQVAVGGVEKCLLIIDPCGGK
jgi:hypothetical protein